MKIGELQNHCGNCKLINYCTEPYETPHLCAYEELEYVNEETYLQIAENITEKEIEDKLRQYEENNISPWTDNHNGAICDIVLEKLEKAAVTKIIGKECRAVTYNERIKELENENEELKICLQSISSFEKEMHDNSLKIAREIVAGNSKAIANIILNMQFGNKSNVSFCEIFNLKPDGCKNHKRCTDCIHDFLIKEYRPISEEKAETIINGFEELEQYREIGTVEECREAREKKKVKKPNIWGDGYDDEGNMIYDMYDCPNCGKSYEIDYDDYKYCPNCGQAISGERDHE